MKSTKWKAVSGSAELISAIAVVITLIYVGIQVKQNTAASLAQTIHQVNTQYATLMSHIAVNSELATIYRIATEGGELYPDQATRYRAYLSAFFLLGLRKII